MKTHSSNNNRASRSSVGFIGLAISTAVLIVMLSIGRTLPSNPYGEAASTLPRSVSTAQASASIPAPPLTVQPSASIPHPIYTMIQPSLVIPTPSHFAPLPTADAAQVIRQGDFGTWNYKVTQSSRGIIANIYYDSSSVEALKNYALENARLASLLQTQNNQVHVNITFRQYITPERFRVWLTLTNLQVEEIDLRTFDENGQPATLFIRPSSDIKEPLAQSSLNQALIRADGQAPDTLKGVFFISGTIPAKDLSQLTSDSSVFLVDVTSAYVYNELRNNGILNVDPRANNVIPPSPMWEMERLGLENFRK